MTEHDTHPIAWLEQGTGPEVVVFLHALVGSRTAWMPQITGLSDTFRCVAWDMPGFGASADVDLDMDLAVAMLAEFVTGALGVEKAHFVGLSVGGMILQHFAAAHPEITKSIAILDSSPKFGLDGSITPADFADPIIKQLNGGASVDEFATDMVRAMVRPDCPEAVINEAIAATSRARIPGLINAINLIAQHDAMDAHAKIGCPALLMAGAQDGETPPEYAYQIAQRIGDASVTIIPDAGHISNLENPEAVTNRLRCFLEHQL